MTRRGAVPPRSIAPGDVVTAFSEALGEWTVAQVTDLDPSRGSVGVLDLAWSGAEPNSLEALGDLVPLHLTHHAWAGRPSHCNFDWLLPRGCRVIGNVPPLVDRKSSSYAWGWRLGDQLAHQRRWDRDERAAERYLQTVSARPLIVIRAKCGHRPSPGCTASSPPAHASHVAVSGRSRLGAVAAWHARVRRSGL